MNNIKSALLDQVDNSVLIPYQGDARFDLENLIKSKQEIITSIGYDEDMFRSDLFDVLSIDYKEQFDVNKPVAFAKKYFRGSENISIVVLLSGLFDFFEITDPILRKAAVAMAVYANVTHDLEYHNNTHFRKVIFHMARLIAVHNNIFEQTQTCLKERHIALLLIAAAIHDIGHQGTGNIINRKYIFAKTEKRSFEIIAPALKACGITDDILDDLLIILMGTDVSPFGDIMSPANQVRAAYLSHYGTDEDMEDPLLSPEFHALEHRPRLCLMALMLHEADIMNSAAFDYEITKMESCAISREVGRENALPEDTLLFLDRICGGELVSPAGQLIGAKPMMVIKEKVIEDYKNGNQCYL